MKKKKKKKTALPNEFHRMVKLRGGRVHESKKTYKRNDKHKIDYKRNDFT